MFSCQSIFKKKIEEKNNKRNAPVSVFRLDYSPVSQVQSLMRATAEVCFVLSGIFSNQIKLEPCSN